MSWIQLRSGRVFDFQQMLQGGDQFIDDGDIGWALGHLCRFTGHTRRFYSVAEHTLNMIRVARQAPTDFSPRGKIELEGAILLHDAHEALIGDVSSPLKMMLGDQFRDFDRNISRCVRKTLGGPPLDSIAWDNCKKVDALMLRLEAQDLMAWPTREWDMLIPDDGVYLCIGETELSCQQWSMKWIDGFRDWKKRYAEFNK